MAQKSMHTRIRIAIASYTIGLLLIEVGLFCYSFYDPTIKWSPDWFPYRGFAYLLLPLGAMALFIGTAALIEANEKEEK